MAITCPGSSNFNEMVSPIIPINMMGGKAEYNDDFITVYKNFMPSAVCNDIISFYKQWKDQAVKQHMEKDLRSRQAFDNYEESQSGNHQFSTGSLGRSDLSIMLETLNTPLTARVQQYLQSGVNDYCAQYNALNSTPLTSWCVKMQETPAGGGYHVYHYERGSWSETARELVWMIYLNEDFEGGETEFLYQKRRIKPTTGTLLIWPAGFTHTHKGNLVLSGTKYVVTGWYYQQPV